MISPVIRRLSARYADDTVRCAKGAQMLPPQLPDGCIRPLNLAVVLWISSRHR
jgi:hypothetical protein